MQNRRNFIRYTGNALFAAALAQAGALAESGKVEKSSSRRPNIIFLLSDDQRDDTLGCAGHPILKTPVIDSLAAQGIRFENAFVTTSICAASRASILTGTHERTHGYTFGKPPVPASIAKYNYPQLLKQAGYRTGFFGKYGAQMRSNPQDMFDQFKTVDRNPYFRELPDGSKRHETDLVADHAIEFIDSQQKDQPFCLSLSFNAAHAEDGDHRPGSGHFPWPPSADGMYADVKMPRPRLDDEEIFESQPEFLKKSMNRKRYYWRWDTPEKYEANMRAYFRMISGIDNAIGRIRQTLAERGLADNTIIIYMGDNGYYMGDRGFAGKWSHYEESLRVPLIIYDPRAPKDVRGKVVDSMALNIDIPATILDAAGLPTPSTYAGHSLMPAVNGDGDPEDRDYFFCEHLMEHKDIPKWEGIRHKRYVYARYFGQNPEYEFLHDLKKDPDQLRNFADDPDYASVLERLRRETDESVRRYTRKAE